MEKVLKAAQEFVGESMASVRGLVGPTNPLRAKFRRLQAPSIPRSSHTVSVIGGKAYIFGGEIAPRQPVDNAMHVVTISHETIGQAEYKAVEAKPSSTGGPVPEARVGHSAAVIGECIYIFGGRGGAAMTALPEHGRVWSFDTTTSTWTPLDPKAGSPQPDLRSYHTSTATQFPLPKGTPNVSNVLLEESPKSIKDLAEVPKANSYGTLFIHAGCLAEGRTSDLWAFDLSSRSWIQFPSAPGSPRGGTSLVNVRERLYRFGGFNGKTEEGGAVDFLALNIDDQFDDEGGKGTMAVSPVGSWRSIPFASASSEDGAQGHQTYPANRSVLGLAPVSIGQGREYLLMICGEGEASKTGHAGAGRFFDDVWSFQLKPVGNTAASWNDATKEYLLGQETGEGGCVEVEYSEVPGGVVDGDGELSISADHTNAQAGQEKPMGRRGWLACAPCDDSGRSVLIWGGINENNKRLGDGWVITVE